MMRLRQCRRSRGDPAVAFCCPQVVKHRQTCNQPVLSREPPGDDHRQLWWLMGRKRGVVRCLEVGQRGEKCVMGAGGFGRRLPGEMWHSISGKVVLLALRY